MLLKRPLDHRGRLETVNDLDCHISNLWRSVQHDPDAVIRAADWPVNEADLHARHLWLVEWMTAERRERFKTDPAYHEAVVAGWWLWGISQWIGGGWCELVYRRSPEVATGGRGVVTVPPRRRPDGGAAANGGGAMGVVRKRPMIGALQNTPGVGVHRRRPSVSTSRWKADAQGVMGHGDWRDLISALCDRLRYVRVCAGDWRRVVTPAVTGHEVGTCGVLLDPPYSREAGRAACYAAEDWSVAHDVRQWCLENGEHPRLRLALCGYEGEHDELEDHGWTVVEWKATGGMSRGGNSRGAQNRHRERIWFSPSCLVPEPDRQLGLFGEEN